LNHPINNLLDKEKKSKKDAKKNNIKVKQVVYLVGYWKSQMFFYMKPDNFKIENIQFMKMKKNIIMENSSFVKIIYSDEFLIMNGIYMEFEISIINRNKMFCYLKPFTENKELEIYEKYFAIERELLQYYKIYKNLDKTPIYSLKQQLEKFFIKMGNYNFGLVTQITKSKVLLKISGIWENDDNIGINFKFI
jgi:hypothetical protein